MDFTPDEATDQVSGLARDIVTRLSTDERVADLEARGADIDDALWRELAGTGLLGLELDSAVVGDSGADASIVESVAVAEQLGRAMARVPFGAHAIAAAPVIIRRASPSLRDSTLAAVVGGREIVSVAFEEDLGSDPLAPHCALTATGDGWSLTGTKVNVGYASAAGLLLVNAASADGPQVAVVRTDAPGIEIINTPVTGKTPTFIVEFTDVALAADDLLTGGSDAVVEVADRMTLAICADQCGILARALELTAAYATEREQFGRAIGSFQAVAQRLADGYIDAQGLQLTTTQAVWMYAQAAGGIESNSDGVTSESALAEGDPYTDAELRTAVQTAKFWACDAGHRIAHTAVHVHGGVGLDTSHPAHRYFLRAKQNEFTLGSSPVALGKIGAALAATPA